MKNNAPVVIYTYTRLDHLKKTISALQANHLATKTDLFVVSDGPKDHAAKKQIKLLRDYVDSVDGFNAVNKIYREKNLGVSQSSLLAGEQVVSDYGKMINIEDDIVTSRNFLDFINAGLNYYECSDEVYSISGYCHPISFPEKPDFDSWHSPWFCPWGYGVWKKQYDRIDREFNPYYEIKKNKKKFQFFKKYGSFFHDSLEDDAKKRVVILDARIAAQMLLLGMSSAMPSKSKVLNIGLDGSGTHCPQTNKYDVDLDDGLQREFSFYPGPLDMNRDEVIKYSQFMNGTSVDRVKRDVMRHLRKVEMLQLIKKKLLS